MGENDRKDPVFTLRVCIVMSGVPKDSRKEERRPDIN